MTKLPNKDSIKKLNDINTDFISNPYFIIKEYLISNTLIYRNEVTWQLEIDGVVQNEQDLHSLFINFQLDNPRNKNISWQMFERVLNSKEIPYKNQIIEYFEMLPSVEGIDNIEKLCESLNILPIVNLDMEGKAVFDIKHYTRHIIHKMIIKWLVGMVASAYDKNYNPLMLVLIGPVGCGKTEFIRRLLPLELNGYYAESKFDNGKDTEALMCEKLLILNDELDGLHTKEAKEFRRIISANQFSYRPPYGRTNITRKRLASVAGTANDRAVILEGEHNRRIIPVEISSVHHATYNEVDKRLVLAEALTLFKQGYSWNLSSEEIYKLKQISQEHEIVSLELEILQTNFSPTGGKVEMTATEIKTELEKVTGQKLALNPLGKALRRLKFERKAVKVNGMSVYKYVVNPLIKV